MKIAMVGTRGVPARYGGFETCVEEVGRRLVERGHEVVVYCRAMAGDNAARPAEYLGMQLVHLPAVRQKVAETLSHTALSVSHIVAHPVDAAFVFNAANAPLLPVLRARGIPVATHVDGLEWQRAKWGGNGKRYYRKAESLAVRWSDALIADAQGIADYYRAEFQADTDLIAYGAPILAGAGSSRLAEVGVRPGEYHLVVARFEPENHVDTIVAGYRASGARHPLVVVGSAPYADVHTAQIHALADERVIFLGGVWDQELLDELYANAVTYLHGHSVGGTNPSLLRAIGAGAASIAYNVSFNAEVLGRAGRYFTTADHVTHLIEAAEADPVGTRRRGEGAVLRARNYSWDDVAARYEQLAIELPARRAARATAVAPTGRRTSVGTARVEAAKAAAAAQRPIVTGFLCGDFDLFHVGDLEALEQASSACDRLIVGVLDDALVEQVTGRPPAAPAADRCEVIRHVRGVDDVVVVGDADPLGWQQAYGFDVLFTGRSTGVDYDGDEATPTAAGARVIALDSHRITTSALLRPAVERLAALVTLDGRTPR